MALSDEELKEVVQQLLSALRQNKLEWVAEQVEETISQGNVKSKSLRELGFPRDIMQSDELSWKVPRQQQFLVAEEYTLQEQLRLVLDAIERSIIHVHQMASHTLAELDEYFNLPAKIEFRSETDETESFALTEDAVSDKASSVKKLADLLEGFRKEI